MNFSAPVNSLSFGYCSFHLLNQFFERKIDLNLFPIGGGVDLTSYPAASLEFQDYLKRSIHYGLEKFSKNDKTLSLWHITNGSEQSYGVRRNLFTFFELSELTKTEVNILNQQDTVFVTNDYTKKVIDSQCKTEVIVAPLGFDNLHFRKSSRRPYNDGRIVFGIAGKLEITRKAHAKTIQNWIKKFGNDRRYCLHLHVHNPFLSQEQNNALLNQIFNGNKPWNVNILPFVQNLVQLNDCYNAIDIIIDMSRGEGFSLPSFHCLALGKHGVIHNATAMRDWANNENAVLVESNGNLIEPFDGMFFHKGAKSNQGRLHDWNDDDFCDALDISIERFTKNKVNESGLKLQQNFTWDRCVNIILENLK